MSLGLRVERTLAKEPCDRKGQGTPAKRVHEQDKGFLQGRAPRLCLSLTSVG